MLLVESEKKSILLVDNRATVKTLNILARKRKGEALRLREDGRGGDSGNQEKGRVGGWSPTTGRRLYSALISSSERPE
ncbi:MAG: hypothetical protein J6T45_00995 [Fibrobacterales bacterium]|nr:hypothetical protein [Fibrobacterales bacterium]